MTIQFKGNPAAAAALLRYLGEDFELSLLGVRRKQLGVTPDYGTTQVKPLICRINGKRASMDRGIPQGSPVPY